MMPCAGLWGLLGGVRAPVALEVRVERSSPAISLLLSRRPCRHRPRRPRGRIECCWMRD